MNCKLASTKLSAYIDRELGTDEMMQIRQHLASCSACASEAKALESLKFALNRTASVEVPEGLEERLFARLRMEPIGTDEPAVAPAAKPWRLVGAMAVAASIGLFATLLVLRLNAGPSPSRPKLDQFSARMSSDALPVGMEIGREQMLQSSTDPFAGPVGGLPAVYGGR